ncbi:MAG: hypothetical protein WBB28_18235 [Crinalium sp.]
MRQDMSNQSRDCLTLVYNLTIAIFAAVKAIANLDQKMLEHPDSKTPPR